MNPSGEAVTAAAERRHRASGDRWWGERWAFDFLSPDGSLGGFVRITVLPRMNVAWFCAAVVGSGHGYVLCRDHDLAPPADPNVIELRGGSLWTHAICETPLEHWTVAMEAYALSFDDPIEAIRSERGNLLGLAFDLEWETPPEAVRWSNAEQTRYDAWGEVHGILQIADDEWTIAGVGSRHHAWANGTAEDQPLAVATGITAPFFAETSTGSHAQVGVLLGGRWEFGTLAETRE